MSIEGQDGGRLPIVNRQSPIGNGAKRPMIQAANPVTIYNAYGRPARGNAKSQANSRSYTMRDSRRDFMATSSVETGEQEKQSANPAGIIVDYRSIGRYDIYIRFNGDPDRSGR